MTDADPKMGSEDFADIHVDEGPASVSDRWGPGAGRPQRRIPVQRRDPAARRRCLRASLKSGSPARMMEPDPARPKRARRVAISASTRCARVTLLVVPYHTSITYGASGGWYYKIAPSQTPSGLLLTLFGGEPGLVHGPVLCWRVISRLGLRSPRRCGLRARAAGRLGIPLLAHAFVLHPLTVADRRKRRAADRSAATFLASGRMGGSARPALVRRGAT